MVPEEPAGRSNNSTLVQTYSLLVSAEERVAAEATARPLLPVVVTMAMQLPLLPVVVVTMAMQLRLVVEMVQVVVEMVEAAMQLRLVVGMAQEVVAKEGTKLDFLVVGLVQETVEMARLAANSLLPLRYDS